jgi:hypothetical protein
MYTNQLVLWKPVGNIHRNISRYTVRNGRSVFFWQDKWILSESLATAFPALYSHHTHALVHDVLVNEICNGLQNRLANASWEQLALLSDLLQDAVLIIWRNRRPSAAWWLQLLHQGCLYMHIQGQLQDVEAAHTWSPKSKESTFSTNTSFCQMNVHDAKLLLTTGNTSSSSDQQRLQSASDMGWMPESPIWGSLLRPMDYTSTPLPSDLPQPIWNSAALVVLSKIWDTGNGKVIGASDQSTTMTVINILLDFTLTCNLHFVPLT